VKGRKINSSPAMLFMAGQPWSLAGPLCNFHRYIPTARR